MANQRVLVADDSDTVRAAVRIELAGRGYTVVEACDGRAALDLLAEHPVDVILLDLQMPELDGHQVLAQLTADASLSTIPVVVLSGRTDTSDVVAALESGAHDYLTKPFAPAELAARVAAATRTKAAQDELRQRSDELEAFATRASHDLKSPLAIIKGMAEVLEAEGRLTDDQRADLLRRITVAAARAARMVDDLLTLARFADPATVGETVTDPQALAEDVVDAAALDRAAVDVAGDWAPVAVGTADLRATLANLVDNASHYGRSADGTLHLAITGSVDETAVTIDVADQGRGVPADEREQIFAPFYRAADSLSANPASTGIGLAIVWRAMARAGAHVELRDAEPTGACFRLRLPRRLA